MEKKTWGGAAVFLAVQTALYLLFLAMDWASGATR